MVSFSWFQWLSAARVFTFGAKARKRPAPTVLRVEGLEDRALLSANLPVAVDDPSYFVDEDQQLNGTSVLSNDTDDDGDTIDEAVLDTDVSHGLLVLNLNGTFSYTPNPNFFGTDSFTYFARDSANNEMSAAPATVTITVNPVNDLNANDDSFTTGEDTLLSDSVATNDTTISGGSLAYALDTQASNGVAVVNSDGTFTYLPDLNFHGTDSFSYTVTDVNAGETATRTVSISVTSVNDAPIANADSLATNEDTQFDGTLTGTDVDGDTLTFALDTQAAHGVATVNPDGTFSYVPVANFHGTDSFTFVVNDGTVDSAAAVVAITINSVTDLTAGDKSFTTDEDTLLTDTLATNDSTTSGGPLTYALDTQATNGLAVVNSDGTFTYLPNSNFHGTDSFTYTVSDADADEIATRTVSITVTPVTDLLANDDSFTTDEDTLLSDTLTTNDTTTSGGPLTYALDSQASNGPAVVNSDGTFTYLPDLNFHGTDSFSYTVTDVNAGETATRTVSISVTSVNDAPIANADSLATNEDTQFDGTLTGTDVDGDTLTFALDTQAAHGVATVNPDGTFSYVPVANFHGTDSFTFVVNDGTVDSAAAVVAITINSVIDLTAGDKSFTTDEETLLTDTLATNDTTTSGGPLTYALDSQASSGLAVVNSDGTFTYLPNSNFHGTDSFTYTVSDADADEIATRTVSITVNQVTDLIANDDSFTTDEDTLLSDTLTTNDTTTSGGQLTYALDSQASNGLAVVNSDGTFTYLSDLNFHGTDSFTYTVTDANANESVTRTVTISINPVTDLIANDDSLTTDEDAQLSGFVGINDSTNSGGTLTYVLDTQASHGVAVMLSDGTFTYLPNLNFHGGDSFTYTVTDADANETATRTVSITISPVNDAPIANAVSFATDEDTQLDGTLTGSDVEGDALTSALGAQAAHGTATVNVDGTFSYVPNANFHGSDSFTFLTNDGTVNSLEAIVTVTVNSVNDAPVADPLTISTDEDTQFDGVLTGSDIDGDSLTFTLGTQAAHGAATVNPDGTFSYLPNADFHGSDSFTFRVNDGTVDSIEAAVTVTVNSVNDAPVADPVTFSTDEDTQFDGVLTGSDIDGDAIAFALASQAAHGTATVHSDGTFSYVPNADFHGSDTFTFTVNDGLIDSVPAIVTITVNSVNDAPTGNSLSFTTGVNTQYDGVLTGSDIDGDAITFALGTQATHGTAAVNPDGTFSYVPDADFHGTDSFTFVVHDGLLSSSPTTVTVTVNGLPVADPFAFSLDEDTQFDGTLTGSDPDGDAFTFALASQAAHGTATVNSNGTFNYVPNVNFHGSDSFAFIVHDGLSNSVPATVTITVNSVNDVPEANPTSFATDEDTTYNGSLAGSDFDGDILTFSLETPAAHGTATVNPDGTFTYVPNANFHGSDSFTFVVNDGSVNSLPATVIITVISVNDTPVANPTSFATDEDTTFNGTLTATDSDNDVLFFSLGTPATNGTVTVNPNGTFSYIPNSNFHGSDSFTFLVNDGTVNSASATVSITVDSVNDLPVGDPFVFSTNEDTTYNGLLTGSDLDGDSLFFVLGSQASHGTATVNVDGTFSYAPTANFHGTDSFTFKVSDGTAISTPVTVTITVNSINDAPTLTNGSGTTIQNHILNGSVSSLGFDADGDALTYLVVTPPAHGTLSLSPDGTFAYLPTPGYSGPDAFTFKANDGQADSNVATFSLTVTPAPNVPLTLVLPSNAATVGKNSAQVQVDPAASVGDPDTVVNYGNAKITASILTGNLPTDISKSRVKLSVRNQGTGAGLVKVKGTKIFFDGQKTAIAKITGGTKGHPLVITFTGAATEQAVNAVLKQLSIQASKKASSGPRTIGIEVIAGGQTAQATKTANIS